MSSGTPDPRPPSRLRQFWNRRSWIGKTAIVVGVLFALLIIIGVAVPPAEDDDPPTEAVNESEEPQDDTTTEEAAGEEAATDEAETTTEEAAPPPPPPRVARVIDGDTLKLASGRTIRLVQIDAPERNECYSRQATATLRRLVAGTEVRLVRDPRLDNRDRFGRLLRYVFKGRQNVNVLLVRRGAASVWFFQGDRGRHAARLTGAADQARANRRGAWGDCEASYDFLAAWTTSKKPPPQPVVTAQPASDCHPSYKGACLDPFASDYDCAGGEGNGPEYTGLVRVVGDDEYGLDGDSDGIGCEDS